MMQVKTKTHVVRVYNNSKQLIQLQLRPPGSDFYTNEIQVRINPGQDVLVPKTHLLYSQVENLKKRGFIKILHDSEVAAEQQMTIAG
jgi:hypothetical protein